MTFDFDNVPSRVGTDSQKWQKYEGQDILPLWVADMDFPSAPSILQALHRRVDHGLFGYARPTRATTEAMVAAMSRRYGWTIDASWIVWLPGLVCGLNVAARALAEAGEAVLSLSPVYPPFASGPKFQSRQSQQVPLKLTDRWEVDWDALAAAVTPKTKIFYLCHPHNPVARVWRPEELRQIAEFCARHNLTLCSDEIHCDLILEPSLARHVPAAVAAPEHAGRVVTMMAPSKTYNVPGLGTSFVIISDPALRNRFVHGTRGIVAEVTGLGYIACEAAYNDPISEDWRQALLAYLRGNRDFIRTTLERDFPRIRLEAPIEATYLAWLNVERMGLAHPHAHFESLGVGLSDGGPFGVPPGKYVRLNFGCPRAALEAVFARLGPLKG